MQTRKVVTDFLQQTHGKAEGYFTLWDKQTKWPEPFHTSRIEDAARYVEQHASSRDIYFGTGLFDTPPPPGSRGENKDVRTLTIISGDIDTAEGEHKADKATLPADDEEALSLFEKLPKPSIILHTGGGLHYHYILKEPIRDMERARQLKLAVQTRIKLTAQERGWRVDPTHDLARVLRLPGTYNHKSGSPKPVTVLHNSGKEFPAELFDTYLPLIERKAKPQKKQDRSISYDLDTIREMLRVMNVDPDSQERLHHDERFTIMAALYSIFGEQTTHDLLMEAWGEDQSEWIKDKLPSLVDKEYSYTIGTVVRYAKLSGWSGKLITHEEQPEREPLPIDLQIEQKQLQLELPATKVVMIKSPKGTGKTYQMRQWLKQLREQDKYLRLLSVTHRVSLGRTLKQGLDADFYSEQGQLAVCTSRRLVVTVDSLHKLEALRKKKRLNPQVLILDEIEQLLAHATGDTLKATRRDCIGSLEYFMLHAEKVICLDAGLSSKSYQYILSLLEEQGGGKEQITVIENTYQALRKKILMQPSREAWTKSLLDDLKAGLRLWVASSSIKYLKKLEKMIKQELPELRLIRICSDTSGTEEAQHFLANVSEEVINYEAVLASPSVGTGVSIDTMPGQEHHFEKVYLLGEARPVTASDLLQMALRVRHTRQGQIVAWINPQRMSRVTKPEKLITWAHDHYKKTEEWLWKFSLITGEIEPTHPRYLQLWAKVTADRNYSLNRLLSNFVRAAKAEGHSITWAKEIAEAEEQVIRAQVKAAGKVTAEEWAALVTSVEPVDWMEYRELKQSMGLSLIERAQVVQHEIVELTGVEPTGIDAALIADYESGLRSRVKAMVLHTLTQKEALSLDKEEQAKKYLMPDYSHHAVRQAFRREALEAAGVAGILSRHTDLRIPLYISSPSIGTKVKIRESFPEWAEANKDRLSGLLGLRVRDDIRDKPKYLLADVLGQMGIELETKRARIKGTKERGYEHQIIPASVTRMLQLAKRYREQHPLPQEEEEWIIIAGPKSDLAA